ASDGSYQFSGLTAGTYAITETPPAAYLAGQTSMGTINGSRAGDIGPIANEVSNIVLPAGVNGINFGAISPTTGSSLISANFNGTAIPAGDSIWFSSVLKASNLGTGPVTIRFVNQTISFTVNGTPYNLAVPNASITFSSANSVSSTTFDS